jgi:hypothetical protein
MRIAIIWIFVTTILATLLIHNSFSNIPAGGAKTNEIMRKQSQLQIVEELLNSNVINKDLLKKKYAELETKNLKHDVINIQFDGIGLAIALIIFTGINAINCFLLIWIFFKLSFPKKDELQTPSSI